MLTRGRRSEASERRLDFEISCLPWHWRWWLDLGQFALFVLFCVLVLVLPGCGPVPLVIDNESSAEWAGTAAGTADLDRVVDLAAAHWGRPRNELDGWTLRLVDGAISTCGDLAPTSGSFGGCTDPGESLVTVRADMGECGALATTVHEIGHALIGDPYHRSPLWVGLWTVVAGVPACAGTATP